MMDPGILAIRKHLNESDLTVALPELRRWFDDLSREYPTAPDVSVLRVQIAGRNCELTSTPGAAKDRLIVYFHGGGFALGSVGGYRHFTSELGRAAQAPVLSVDYRLSPEHAFPAAIEDGTAACEYALGRALNAEQIAVAGDSAGASIALGSLLALQAAGKAAPRHALFISPWIDLEVTGATMVSKAAEDPWVPREATIASAKTYLGGADPHSLLAAPLLADLSFLRSMLIQVGSAEALLDDSVRLAGAAGTAGVDVRLEIWSRMLHIWPFFYPIVKAGRDALNKAGTFLGEALSATQQTPSA